MIAIIRILLLGMLLATGRSAGAQQAAQPAYILVELPTMTERTAYLEQQCNADLANVLQAEVAYVRQLIVQDWSRNFRWCPVLFYNDTDRQEVGRNPVGVTLLDSNQRVVRPAAVEVGGPHLQAFFGYRYGSTGEGGTSAPAYSWPRLYLRDPGRKVWKAVRPGRAARRAARDLRGMPLDRQVAAGATGFESVLFRELVYMPVAAEAIGK